MRGPRCPRGRWFIALGAELFEACDFVVSYLFGTLLIVTGVRMALGRAHAVDPERSGALRAAAGDPRDP